MILKNIYQWEDIVLHDDDTEYGGTSHHNETLGNFITEAEKNDNITVKQLNTTLKKCGIQSIFCKYKLISSLIDTNEVKNIIYDVKHHDRIDIFMKNPITILLKDFNKHIGIFFNIECIIYDANNHELTLTIDDEYFIGGIQNIEYISEIYSKGKLLYKRRF